MRPKIEVYEDAVGEWRWKLLALNGEIIAASEGYSRAHDAERAVEQFRVYAVDAEVVRLKRDAG